MISEYLGEALKRASYEIIDDDEPFYGEVTELQGVWASGKTLEECRQNLLDVVEGWILLRLSRGMNIPTLGEVQIELPKETIDV
ncbi:MAG: type II toxin-antitoxin system HicB family antitoxin [Cyanobacteriota bacterium]|nr:type II toxin-antitoxin system HicB family antitoxin [Cyanobacteriota bacterium]